MLHTNDQLKGVTIIIDSVQYDDYGDPYSSTRIYRGDLEGSTEDFIEIVEENPRVIELSQMKNT